MVRPSPNVNRPGGESSGSSDADKFNQAPKLCEIPACKAKETSAQKLAQAF
jgi:hypothetical protein